jgi:hypothetical protein
MRTIEENNRLIAEFMGQLFHNGNTCLPEHNRYIGEGNYSSFFKVTDLKYHESWDWLMPVVEKVSSIFGEWDYDDERREKAEDIFYMDNMFSEFISSNIEAIYNRCIQFIEWYNEQN